MTPRKQRASEDTHCVFCIRNELADTGWRTLMGLADILTHAAVAATLVLSIWGLERFMHSLWSDDPTLFKGMGLFEIHLAWLFNATDVGLIVVFSLKSIAIFWGMYRRRSVPI